MIIDDAYQMKMVRIYNMEKKIMEISKKDWKLFREKLPKWQEKYMEKLNQEYIELLQKEGNASDKFWKLEKRIRNDKKKSGVIVELRKSELVYNLVELIRDGVIEICDLDEFSDDLKEIVRHFIER